MLRVGSRRFSWANSKSRQALRVVVANFHPGDLVERPVGPRGVAHQYRGISVDLVEIGSIRRNPVIARSAGDGGVETSGRAVARNLRACRILRDFQATAVDVVAADVAVPNSDIGQLLNERRKIQKVTRGARPS